MWKIWLLAGMLLLPGVGWGAEEEALLYGCADPTIVENPAVPGELVLMATGPGLPIYRSRDLVHWKLDHRVFKDRVPAWAKKAVPGSRGIWAPDLVFFNGRYHAYYSVSTFGSQDSVIGLAVNPTLDRSDPAYHWEDRGEVIRSRIGKHAFNAIDPAVFPDRDGKVYMVWGSFWTGIKLTELDPGTGKPKPGAPIISLVDRGVPPNAVEAAYLVYREGMYYLFVSFDHCCDGASSTYRIMVGRAPIITGPYLDAAGTPMTGGGGTLVLANHGRWRGPGHNSVLKNSTGEWLVHHTYDMHHLKAHRILQVRPLRWPSSGWPVAGEPLVQTYRKEPVAVNRESVLGTWELMVDYQEPPEIIHLLPDGVMQEPGRGQHTWSLEQGRLYLSWRTDPAAEAAREDELFVAPSGDTLIGRRQTGQVVRGVRVRSAP